MTERRLGAAAVIRDRQGRVLLVRHSYGRLNWELPGGLGESNESTIETAIREVREETGLEVAAERTTGVYYERGDDMHHFVFLCRPLDETVAPRPDLSEITNCGYFSPDALPRPISDFTIRRIVDAVSGAAPPLPVVVPPRTWLE